MELKNFIMIIHLFTVHKIVILNCCIIISAGLTNLNNQFEISIME